MAISTASPAYENIARQLSARTGIVVSRTPEDFERALNNTIRLTSLQSLEDLDARLSAGLCWDELIAEVTVGETYFFRCPEHFDWVREHVVPALRRRCEAGQPLRAWSAGCASGEEAYSIAIVLHEAGLLDHARVLGSDVSASALVKARAARYREWSFRAVDPAFIARYFEGSAGSTRSLIGTIRERVEFGQINLATDLYPSSHNSTRDMDLILCRNVLIYFDFETIGRVARQLFDALAPGGWLIAGPSDPMLAEYAPFEVMLPGQGICYRRPKLGEPSARSLTANSRTEAATQPLTSMRSVSAVSAGHWPASVPSTAGANESRHSDGERAALLHAVQERPSDLQLAIGVVQATWNSVDSLAAHRACQVAIAQHPSSPELHYLDAIALLDAGELQEALAAVRRALYLDRTLSIAHFTLGSILERMHDRDAARRAYRNAYDGACAQPPDAVMRLSDGIAAAGLAAAAARALTALSGGGES